MVSQYPPKKNAAFTAVFPILDADGDLVTGAAGLDSEISKDKGTFADCTNEATELATSSGMYYLDLTATEMNADIVAVIVKTSTSGAKTTPLVFYTSAQLLDDVDTVADAIKAKTDNLPADPADDSDIDGQLATIDTVVDAIKAKTDNLPTDPADQSLLVAEHDSTQADIAALNDITAASVWAVGTRALTDKAGFSLSAAGIDSIIDEVIEGTTTLRQAVRLFLSALASKSSGGGTATLVFRDIGDSKARITATVDANGNRTAMTLDAT